MNKLPAITVITNPPKITQPTAEVTDLTQNERREIVYGLGPMAEDETITDTTPEN